MKRALILAAAITSLAVPAAMAQTNTSAGQTNSSQGQMNNSQGMQQQGTINPEQLNTQQVRQIQTALKKQGFDTGKADGKWGKETENAINKFQQQKNLQGNGQLDQQTLSALGVNVSSTEGSSSRENSSSNNPSKSQSRQ